MSTKVPVEYVCEECGHKLPGQYVRGFVINGRVVCPYCGRTMVKAQ